MENPNSTPAPSPVAERNILAEGAALTIAGAIVRFAFSLLYRANNVRSAATLRIPEMVASFLRNAYVQSHPLMVSVKADGRALVLRGNRRTEALEWLAANAPADFARILPDGMVPVVAYYNLTEEQETLLRIDHGSDEDRIPLDEMGEFNAVRQLVKAGYLTESGIAEKLGKYRTVKATGKTEPNRSWVQPRVALAQLPAFVQSEFAKLWIDGPAATPVRVSMILRPLYRIFNSEYRNYPDGNGPAFTAEWATCLGKTHAAAVKKITITPAAALVFAKGCGSRNLREALKIVAGEGADGARIPDIDAACVLVESAAATLAEIADYLGETDYAELVNASRAKAQAAAQAAALANVAPPIVADDAEIIGDEIGDDAEQLETAETV